MVKAIKKQKQKIKVLDYIHFSLLSFWLIFFTCIFSFQAFAQEVVVKFGTLAPAGSVWVDVVQEISNQISQKTKERIKWISYTGGVMGDEEEMIRKIRIGQLQGGGFTINGIKKIAPELEVLDLPFMFRDEKEVDYIYDKFFDEFEKYFEQRGFKLLLFTEQGFIYWYSKNPDVKGFRDIGKTRVWAWKGERVMTSIAGILGTSPIYLQVPDVLSGLETGMIDSFQTSPMACLSLQWCKLVKVVINYPYRFEPGVIVISKSAWDKIPKDIQDVVISTFRTSQKESSRRIRQGQAESLEKLRKMGVKFVTPPQEDVEWFKKECQEKLWYSKDVGYPQEFLKKIVSELEKFRAKK
jgi:TRAP-type C4-dicarboxylate transport system substrate-binding protein